MFRRQADIEGGRMIYGREYISALQNRNKTNLLEALGSAPLIVEELIPETSQGTYAKGVLLKSLKGGMRYLAQQAGISQFIGGMQNIAQQATNRMVSRFEFEFETLFLPMQGWLRDIQFAYESYTSQYQMGAGIGGMIGGWVGAAVGWYFLGPIGAAVGGWLGQIGGTFFGVAIEQYGETFAKAWTPQETVPAHPLTRWLPGVYDTGGDSGVGTGGMPRQRMFQNLETHDTRGLVIKMLDLERRFF
jgi:hypothetical protein